MATDEFLAVQRDIEDATRPRPKHPSGWEPGIDTAKRTLVVEAGDTPPSDWSAIISQLGLDPAAWTVDETKPVQVRTWDSGDRRCYYYRATVVPVGEATHPDIDVLIAEAKKAKPKKHANTTDERALVVCLADWQAGKSEGGGVKALTSRLTALMEQVPERVAELKKIGRPVDRLYVIGMGDMVEGCDGHYPMQSFSVELDNRQQERVVRRMLMKMVTRWAALVPQVVVGCVPGNHGERRKDGKAYTTFEDNADLAVFEQVADACATNPEAYGHVKWVIPDGDLTVTLDIAGTVVAFAHGHQAGKGSSPQQKLDNWWQDKMKARHPVGDADVLVTGHYHHLQVVQDGERTWMQCPANDGGSRWFEERGGSKTKQGTLTFTADRHGWSDLAVLS